MRRMLLGLGFLLMAAPLTAQPPITRDALRVLAVEDRSRSTATSITYTVAADANPNGDLSVRLDIPREVDWSDGRNQAKIQILDYDPAREIWHQHGASHWIGNPVDGYDTEMAVKIGELCSKQVRIEVEVLRAFRVGATMGLREPVE